MSTTSDLIREGGIISIKVVINKQTMRTILRQRKGFGAGLDSAFGSGPERTKKMEITIPDQIEWTRNFSREGTSGNELFDHYFVPHLRAREDQQNEGGGSAERRRRNFPDVSYSETGDVNVKRS